MATLAGSLQPPSHRHPHPMTQITQSEALRGWQGCLGSAGRALTCSPVAILPRPGYPWLPLALKCPQAGGMRQPSQLQLVGWEGRVLGRGCWACPCWGAGRWRDPP